MVIHPPKWKKQLFIIFLSSIGFQILLLPITVFCVTDKDWEKIVIILLVLFLEMLPLPMHDAFTVLTLDRRGMTVKFLRKTRFTPWKKLCFIGEVPFNNVSYLVFSGIPPVRRRDGRLGELLYGSYVTLDCMLGSPFHSVRLPKPDPVQYTQIMSFCGGTKAEGRLPGNRFLQFVIVTVAELIYSAPLFVIGLLCVGL